MKRFIAVFLGLWLTACAGAAEYKSPEIRATDLRNAEQTLRGARSVAMPEFERTPEEIDAVFSRVTERLSEGMGPMCDQAGLDRCEFAGVYVENDEMINAYAGDGQTIIVFSGLVKRLETEEEIAAVVAHEIGHHLSDHIAESMKNADTSAAATMYASAGLLGLMLYSAGALDETPAVEAAQAYGAGLYSKEQEMEADLLAVYLLERSGYDAEVASRVWSVLQSASNGADNEWNDSHPTEAQRLAHWQNAIIQARASGDLLPTRD